MESAVDEEEEPSQQRKPGAKPNSVPFTVPENRLLSELYLANKNQYHAKSRVVVGEKNGETSQERFASQFAAELTKLGFAKRTSSQVKQRIADIRKLGHKLIIKEREKGVDYKKRKKVFVEPWLRNVMDALADELHEMPEAFIRTHKRIFSSNVDHMSAMAQNLLDCHRQTNDNGKTTKKKKVEKSDVKQEQSATSSCDQSAPEPSSPSVSDTPLENGEQAQEERIPPPMRATPAFFNRASSNPTRMEILPRPSSSFARLQQKLLETQLRVAQKTEKLLDLKIKKMEVELALATSNQKLQHSLVDNVDLSSGDEDEGSCEGWTNGSGLAGATAEIQVDSGGLIENLLNNLKKEDSD